MLVRTFLVQVLASSFAEVRFDICIVLGVIRLGKLIMIIGIGYNSLQIQKVKNRIQHKPSEISLKLSGKTDCLYYVKNYS